MTPQNDHRRPGRGGDGQLSDYETHVIETSLPRNLSGDGSAVHSGDPIDDEGFASRGQTSDQDRPAQTRQFLEALFPTELDRNERITITWAAPRWADGGYDACW